MVSGGCMKNIFLIIFLSFALFSENSYEVYADSRNTETESGDPDIEGNAFGGRAYLFQDKLMIDISFGSFDQEGPVAGANPPGMTPEWDNEGDFYILRGEYFVFGELSSGALGIVGQIQEYEIDFSIPAFGPNFSGSGESTSNDIGFVYRMEGKEGFNYGVGATHSFIEQSGDESNANFLFVEGGYSFNNGINLRARLSEGYGDFASGLNFSIGYKF